MPKIKNWSKAAMKEDWTHDEKSHTVKIRDAGGNSGLYEVYLHVNYTDRKTMESGRMRENITSASTMDNARKKAVRWMKKHPNSINMC